MIKKAFLLSTLSLLLACGDNDPSAASADKAVKPAASSSSKSTDAIKQALSNTSDNQAQVTLSGAADNTEVDGAADSQAMADTDHIYRPARSMSKKSYARNGTNDEGPYSLIIYTDSIHEDAPDNPVYTILTFHLPENAQPGTYTVSTIGDAEDDQVQASLSGDSYDWRFSADISGVVEIVELSDTISAAWDITAVDKKEREVHATGALKGLHFSPRVELSYEMDTNGETVADIVSASVANNAGQLTVVSGKPSLYLKVPEGTEPGEYPVSMERGSDTVVVKLPNASFDDVTGTVTITENGEDYMNFVFEFETKGEDTVRSKGEFSYVPSERL